MATSAKLTAFAAELQATLDKLLPRQEGFREIRRTGLQVQDTKVDVDTTIDIYQDLREQIETLLTNCTKLSLTTYPEMPKLELEPDEFTDVKQQKEEIELAFTEIVPIAGPAVDAVVDVTIENDSNP